VEVSFIYTTKLPVLLARLLLLGKYSGSGCCDLPHYNIT
jgi:hypothetical protein